MRSRAPESKGTRLKDYVDFPWVVGAARGPAFTHRVHQDHPVRAVARRRLPLLAFGFLHAIYVLTTQIWVSAPFRKKRFGRLIGWISLPLTIYFQF